MNLYGSDMDESISPLEAALGWTVAWEPAERDFIGRAALEQQRKQGTTQKLVGLLLEGKGVLRNHQKVVADGVVKARLPVAASRRPCNAPLPSHAYRKTPVIPAR